MPVGAADPCCPSRALPALLRGSEVVRDQIRERTAQNLTSLRAALRGAATTVLDVEGGWYAVLQPPAIREEEEWALALLEQGLLVHPGHFFDFDREPFLVLSLLLPPDQHREALARLQRVLAG